VTGGERGCEGIGKEAPQLVENRPGLTAIAYRPGTHSRFKASMLSRLSAADLPAVNDLSTRADADLGIALLDGWATVSEVVAFYQERIANEAYLRTATERRSVAELANLVGYVPRPGVAASTYLAFTIEESGAEEEVPVPAGTRVQSIPGPGELPQTFETVESIEGHSEWNAMRPVLTQRHPDLTPGTEVVTVRGTDVNVRRGDSILIVAGAGSSNRVVKRVLAAKVDLERDTTRLELAEDPPSPPPLLFVLLPFAPWEPAPQKLTSSAVANKVLSGSWRQQDLKAFAQVQQWPLPQLSLTIVNLIPLIFDFLPAEKGVFAFRQRAGIFGHNAPLWYDLPAPKPSVNWEGRTLSQEPGNLTREIDLDTTYPGIVKGSWLVLDHPNRRDIVKVEDNTQLSRAAFTISGKVSRIKVSSNASFSSHTLRQTSVLAESEELELAELPVTDVVKGNRLVLDRAYLGLIVGRPVVVTGLRADLHGVTDSEVVIIADLIFNQGRTELVFATSLAGEYVRDTVTVNANVAFATHGETKDEALGSGDADRPFQGFTLAQAPLTYVPARSVTGAASTLEVRVNELLWEEVDFLYGRGPDEHVYITRDDDEGRTHVVFGDGRTGARVPTGRENVRVVYRVGMGAEGLVREGQLTLLGTKPLGVRSVGNPAAAGDAADRDGRDDVRRNAALPIRTLDRIVSLKDYEDFARAFTGIAKALATWTWDGHQRGVFVTVAGVGGKPVPEGGLTHSNLLAVAGVAGEESVPLRVKSYVAAFFRVAAGVRVDPAYRVELVLPALEAALRARFSFDAREFGQDVTRSEVVAAMQAVPGVVAVDLDVLQRTDGRVGRRLFLAAKGSPRLADRLTAATPSAGTNVTVPAELLTLDPRPVDLRVIAA
jgi:predicted phage baseplate assembly protein